MWLSSLEICPRKQNHRKSCPQEGQPKQDAPLRAAPHSRPFKADPSHSSRPANSAE